MTADAETPATVNPRDISYASSAKTAFGAGAIRVIENLTGRLPSLYRLNGYADDVAGGESIWDSLWRRFGFKFVPLAQPLEAIPATGPVVIVSNHPFGIVDGVVLGWIISRRRMDFKIIANALFAKAPELAPFILPVDFEPGREAAKRNMAMRREAQDILAKGGAVAVFAGGAIASAQTPFGHPFDPEWKSFPAKMIATSGAPVIPIYFEGRNSVLFEAGGRIAPAIRYGLNFFEFSRRMKSQIKVAIGEPVSRAGIDTRLADPPKLMAWLRAQTYALSTNPKVRAVNDPETGPPLGPRWS